MIFISHSSRDNHRALRLHEWLRAQGYGDVFLDIDGRQGLVPGQSWQDALKRAGENCQAVIVMVSPDWASSRWCLTEFLLANQLGKRIFPVLIAPTDFKDIPVELVANFQFADISSPALEADGLERLACGLRQAGLDPSHFTWPPPDAPRRVPYRGLEALEETDAAVFFGRDSAITRGIDTLRRIRDGAPERLVAILGASGAGKSSFLRAGLLARLQRDRDNFLCLPVLRPEQTAMTGPHGLRQCLFAALGKRDLKSVDAALSGGPKCVADLLASLAASRARDGKPPPSLVLPIDQGEELFAPGQSEGAAFLAILATLLDPGIGVIALMAIRSDSFELLQNAPQLSGLPRLPFDLPPMAPGAFKDVIEGPARLMTPPLRIDPDLTELLMQELGETDALPLLAFALSRLVDLGAGDGRLDVADYVENIGGLAGAIEGAVEAAFRAALADPALPNTRAELESRAHDAFVPWLVQVDSSARSAKRAVARLDDLPLAARPIIPHFVEQRLLVSSLRDDAVCVEVAHEAILRHWPRLEQWIAEETDRLRALDAAVRAAVDWAAHEAEPDADAWLLHRGSRLAEAERMASQPAYGAKLGTLGRLYLDACRKAARRAARLRRTLLGAVSAAGLAIVVGSLAYVFEFEIDHAWTRWTKSKPLTAGELAALADGQVFRECTEDFVCPDMVVIPAGAFVMGSPDSEADRAEREGPQRMVTFARSFAVSRFEITFAAWSQCVAQTDQRALVRAGREGRPRVGCAPVSNSGFSKGLSADKAAQLPAINLSWDDAKAYVAWLNEMVHGTPDGPYRLLTEAEWEYAARAGSIAAYPWGDAATEICAQANLMTAATKERYPWFIGDPAACEDGYVESAPAGSYPPNAFGLFDMNGNVWEWVEDCYVPYAAAPDDGSAVPSNACDVRVLRGGSWLMGPSGIRSAYRGRFEPVNLDNNTGFRIARTL